VLVNVNEITKRISFPCKTPVGGYGFVVLKLKKGFFGYEVIAGKRLKEGK